MRQPLDPRRVNVCLDNNALQPPGGDLADVSRFERLREAGTFQIVVPYGVVDEARHPSTPAAVRTALTSGIFTIPTTPTDGERRLRAAIAAELQGNAKPGKHAADATHLAEACKYGGYFITHDSRVLERAGNLAELLPPSLQVVTLIGFLAIYDRFAKGIS